MSMLYAKLKKENLRGDFYTSDDCTDEKNFTKKVVVLKESFIKENFKEDYHNNENQIVYASAGFGCDPSKIGKGVFVTFLDGESYVKVDRSDVLGVLKPEIVEELGLQDWCQEEG